MKRGAACRGTVPQDAFTRLTSSKAIAAGERRSSIGEKLGRNPLALARQSAYLRTRPAGAQAPTAARETARPLGLPRIRIPLVVRDLPSLTSTHRSLNMLANARVMVAACALAGCNLPLPPNPTPCERDRASMECQVWMYDHVR